MLVLAVMTTPQDSCNVWHLASVSKPFYFCLAAHFVFCSVRFSKKFPRTQTQFQSIGQPKQWNQSLVPPNKWCGISFRCMKMHPNISARKLLVPELSFRLLSYGTQEKKGWSETDPYSSLYRIDHLQVPWEQDRKIAQLRNVSPLPLETSLIR